MQFTKHLTITHFLLLSVTPLNPPIALSLLINNYPTLRSLSPTNSNRPKRKISIKLFLTYKLFDFIQFQQRFKRCKRIYINIQQLVSNF